MPTIKDYQSKKKKARRRPGREEIHKETVAARQEKEDEVEEAFANLPPQDETESFERVAEAVDIEAEDFNEEAPDRKKVHIDFPYSSFVRAKVPKAFEVVENVAEEWVNDGNFENVPVGHPLAQITVAAGLRKAKQVEKKLEETGVFSMAKMGLEYAKSKLQKK